MRVCHHKELRHGKLHTSEHAEDLVGLQVQARRDVSQEGGREARKIGDCGSPQGSVAMVVRSSYTFGGCVGGCNRRRRNIGTETGDKLSY